MARKGQNPSRDSVPLPSFGTVRVIVPVFLPSDDGYFKDGLQILQLLLRSIAGTTDDRVRVSIIDNASSRDVAEVLDKALDHGSIDRLVHNKQNRGKVDAVLSELRATYEPVSVVVDADAVFRRGWVDSVLLALAAFPECGMLGLTPGPGWHASSSAIATSRSSGARLVRVSIADEDDMRRFGASIGRESIPAPARGRHLALERSGCALTVGFGHFAFAVRREVVRDLPAGPSLSARGGTDAAFFEVPADESGWWCLSLSRAAVHHVGNTLDEAERNTIGEFSATELRDEAPTLPPARRATVASIIPARVRRAAAAGVRWSCESGALVAHIAPRANLRLRQASALRVDVPSAPSSE